MTAQQREEEAGMLMMLLDQDKENIAALRKLLIHGTITIEEHTKIFSRIKSNVHETIHALGQLGSEPIAL